MTMSSRLWQNRQHQASLHGVGGIQVGLDLQHILLGLPGMPQLALLLIHTNKGSKPFLANAMQLGAQQAAHVQQLLPAD